MNKWNRREFIAATSVGVAGAAQSAPAGSVSIVVDPRDSVASAVPAVWAAKELENALTSRGVSVQRCERLAQARAGDFRIAVTGSAGTAVAQVPEALGLLPSANPKDRLMRAAGYDARGVTYALLELTDRVRHSAQPMAALSIAKPVWERPANAVRSVSRLFSSDVEDKPWYNDRAMWPQYFTMLATQRFNRFHLALGIGYDFIRQVTDAYFVFSYPFLLNVPGYNVRVPQLPDAERDSNLRMLQFIGEQAVARGIEFQLGLWMHGYEWIDSPHPNYTIAGVDKTNHGPYSRDALRMLLKACPAISGITFRVHGESGVEEGSYDFWKTVFDGVATCGRKVEIDMHAKGIDQNMIDVALATGQKVRVSPKYWAEHLGMPYHQADIRALEKPKADGTGLMKLSSGSRAFLRYGYGDLLREDRKFSVIHRIWPGTQRLLVWGDPQSAAAYSRSFSFCGSDGVDIFEPLSFKGRRGSGIAGDRCAYADATLRPRWDWQKYEYGHRVWGRMLYNPESDPDVWQRWLRGQFSGDAERMGTALANASRILPIVTTAHAASAGNNSYWPEVYLNQSLVDPSHAAPYTDSPAPRVFGNVTPLDPQLFSRINDFADELLKGERSGKYSPVEVAQWIEDYAAAASAALTPPFAALAVRTLGHSNANLRRFDIDIAIQADMGRFFGAKFRAGVLYRIFEKTGDRAALDEALTQYNKARAAFASAADGAKGVYMPDITVGELPQLRGHWLDRLPAMDRDVALVAAKLAGAKVTSDPRVAAAIREALGRPQRVAVTAKHTPAARFRPGAPLNIEVSFDKKPASVMLYYRHVEQAESYEAAEMNAAGNTYRAAIPAAYTDSHYPLEYYFEVRDSAEKATLWPGFGAELTNQPYFVVRAG